MVNRTIVVQQDQLLSLVGEYDHNLRYLANQFTSSIVVRGNNINLSGEASEIKKIDELIHVLLQLIEKKVAITADIIQKQIIQLQNSNGKNPVTEPPLLYSTQNEPIYPKSEGQRRIIEAVHHNDIIFIIGPAGTGKTFLAVTLAVAALHKKEIKRIVLVRPVVEAGESLGFLPGDLKEKITPYLKPLYDALETFLPDDLFKKYFSQNIIEIAPLAYMRGRTLNHSYIILDEAQNTTAMQMKMFLTRLGHHSKVIVTGDITQIDLPNKENSGLVKIQKILVNIAGISFVYLDERDVTRHKLVQNIIQAYQNSENGISSQPSGNKAND